MIFLIEETCFQSDPETFNLITLAKYVTCGRHRIALRNPANAQYFGWVQNLDHDLLDIWQLSLDYSIELEAMEPARLTIRVCANSELNASLPQPIMNLEGAVKIAREPFRVYVENDDADRDFILTFSNDQQRAKIEELESNNMLRFEHCGGIGELKKKIIKFAKAAPLYRAICATVFDSDSTWPGNTSTNAVAVQSACNNEGIEWFMLARRAIENYLAISWLNTWVNAGGRARREAKKDLFNCFCNLDEDQRAHFHMKKGLKADQQEISSGVNTLFSNLSSEQRNILKQGFGSEVGSELYSEPWVQEGDQSVDSEAWREVNSIVNGFLVLCR